MYEEDTAQEQTSGWMLERARRKNRMSELASFMLITDQVAGSDPFALVGSEGRREGLNS